MLKRRLLYAGAAIVGLAVLLAAWPVTRPSAQQASGVTPLIDNDFRKITACAAACPAQSITFGDLNDPHSAVSKLHKSPRAIRLLEELGCKPKVVYLRDTKWRE